MERLSVNPTRMELTRLKKRLVTARRGHKLLKDKRDELMKQFLEYVRRNKKLRKEVEELLKGVNQSFSIAAATMSPTALEECLMCPKQGVELSVDHRNIMSVDVPKFQFATLKEGGEIYPYGFGFTSGELDSAVSNLALVFPKLLELAEVEKTAQLLADEIEKTRRRVNALEYVMIPQIEITIKYISMKMDENERGNTTRLMKVKDMMVQEQIRKERARAN